MSHHIYRTDALVLFSYERGEASRLLTLLTPDFGVVRVHAQSVRLERSRLRYSLEPLSEVSISLVRGRGVWRVVGAETRAQWYYALFRNPGAYHRVMRVARLIERLMPEEGEGIAVYQEFRTLLEREAEGATSAALSEERAVLRILSILGYVPHALLSRFKRVAGSESAPSTPMAEERREMVRVINEALTASQL